MAAGRRAEISVRAPTASVFRRSARQTRRTVPGICRNTEAAFLIRELRDSVGFSEIWAGISPNHAGRAAPMHGNSTGADRLPGAGASDGTDVVRFNRSDRAQRDTAD